MDKCSYCKEIATTEDALGCPTCKRHKSEADNYYEKRTGRKPNADPHLYCKEHGDLWQADCERCETCCLFHYDCSVKEKFGDANTPTGRGVKIIDL